ncbi:WD40-repeat-containing domain protein [Kalaharituber pfeilii]|nr:WD40-repeat-containing domain protein [Kalaharituber pfeilii]
MTTEYPTEMEYESSSIDPDYDQGIDDDSDDDGNDSDYEVALEEQDEDDDLNDQVETIDQELNRDAEVEDLSEDEDGGVRFRLVHADEEIDEDEDNGRQFLRISGGMPFRVEILGFNRRRNPRRNLIQGAEPVPNPEGQRLMKSGDFGAEERFTYPMRPNPKGKPYPHYLRVLEREIGAYRGDRASIGNQLLAQHLLPSTNADFVMHYDSRCYSGQFSADGNFFYSCSQDFRVRMYDTSNPYNWRHYKTMLAYSSIDSVVYAANTTGESTEIMALDFGVGRTQFRNAMYLGTGIWSIRFSGDGRELVAGANDNNLYVYDIETQNVILKLSGHEDDVNAVCFADVNSPHILFSGSDDSTLKVWDRRSMASRQFVGVFAGHLEGLTYIDSKGDGRYVLSNGKDQTMKLWDIRNMMDPSAFDKIKRTNYSVGFDYRSENYDYPAARHPQDCSVVTYRGHSVLRTLIRCHFSPPVSTGSRYVYTGSSDGKVYVYNLDATPASVIDVKEATQYTRPWSDEFMYGHSHWTTCVRDASWHPNAGVLAATSWNAYGATMGSVTLHSWGGVAREKGEKLPRLDCLGKVDLNLYEEEGAEEDGNAAMKRVEARRRDPQDRQRARLMWMRRFL